MDYGIAGRTALVVGGSKGIGLQAAMMLAAEGARVAIVARTQKPIDRAVAAITEAGGEAIGLSADMSSPDGIESAVAEVRERLAPPAIVITQADFHVRGFFAEITRAEDFVDSYRAYTLSQVHLLRAVLPAMQETGWGRFVHIGSGTAKEPQKTPPHTVANDDEARRTWMIETAGVPAGRLGEPSEIASTIVYLCSRQSGYLTGHYITVDGGLHRSALRHSKESSVNEAEERTRRGKNRCERGSRTSTTRCCAPRSSRPSLCSPRRRTGWPL
jgi:3-oxoacyl-[acyl-carrier protein] reductase